MSPTLSYFTTSDIEVGSIVSVPIRSKNIHAIVSEVRPAEEARSEIRNAPFEIRKLNKIKGTNFFSNSFMESCKYLAEYYATNIGSIINSLVTDSLLENISKINITETKKTPSNINTSETYAVQGDDSDRLSTWKSLIRQEFAKKNSVAIYLPTIEDSRNIYEALEKGIEGYIFLLNTELTKKKIIDTWNKISTTEHPVVIVCTSSFSILPRQDIQTIIIERENARGWISQRSPYIDARHALEYISRKDKKNVYLTDNILRIETLYRLDEAEIAEGSPFKWRSVSDAKDSIINMLNNKEIKMSEGSANIEEDEEMKAPFRVISEDLEILIIKNKEENLHLFIMSLRRGISSITICDDCETIVTCHNCNSPMVLHSSRESGKNFFMCHRCGERRSAVEICSKCNSWRLTPLGIGVERISGELKEKFPNHEIIEINADTTKTEKQIKLAMEYWRSHPGSILIGTEMALLHMKEKVDHSAIISLDSLFALPDFRIEEKIMYTLIRLRAMTSRNFLLQTRKPNEKIFEYGTKGNLSDFFRSTLNQRKAFSYPPYKTLIKISIEGKKDDIAESMASIQKEISESYELEIFPAFTSSTHGNSIIHGLIRVENMKWPDAELTKKLRTLPPSVVVKINPESLL
jgi:primosomal protein N' (replication factor Y)